MLMNALKMLSGRMLKRIKASDLEAINLASDLSVNSARLIRELKAEYLHITRMVTSSERIAPESEKVKIKRNVR